MTLIVAVGDYLIGSTLPSRQQALAQNEQARVEVGQPAAATFVALQAPAESRSETIPKRDVY